MISLLKTARTVRRWITIAAILLLIPFSGIRAQEEVETPTGPWTVNLDGVLTATRSSFSNWREGGVNSLGYSAGLKGEAIRQTEAWKHTHNLRMEFGQIKQEELETRKSIDVIQYGFVLQSLGASAFTPTAAVEFRTQFAPGLDPLQIDRSSSADIRNQWTIAVQFRRSRQPYCPPMRTQCVPLRGQQSVLMIARHLEGSLKSVSGNTSR